MCKKRSKMSKIKQKLSIFEKLQTKESLSYRFLTYYASFLVKNSFFSAKKLFFSQINEKREGSDNPLPFLWKIIY